MKMKLKNGLEVDITEEDARNIAKHILHMDATEVESPFTFCERYLNKALANVNKADKNHSEPESEAELKKVWYNNLNGTSENDVELLYEGVEAIVYMALIKFMKRLMPLVDKK